MAYNEYKAYVPVSNRFRPLDATPCTRSLIYHPPHPPLGIRCTEILLKEQPGFHCPTHDQLDRVLNFSVILPLARQSGVLFRIVAWVLIAAAASFFLTLLSLRYWLLPNIEQYRENIATAISSASGQRVTIGNISANWDGLRPKVTLGAVRVHDKEDDVMLLLDSLDGTLSWRSLLDGKLHFRDIVIEQPDLIIRRDVQGGIHIAGLALDKELTGSDNGFSDWLLDQRRVTIKNASVLWRDDRRSTPRLQLLINLRLENRGARHRFGMRAIPRAGLAGQLDMRGDFTGETLNAPEQWQGRLFVQIDRADMAGWRIWLPFPEEAREMELYRGFGALRMWAGLEGTDLKKLTADMRLSNVRARLAPGLPDLILHRVRGRIGWQKAHPATNGEMEIFARNLQATIQGRKDVLPTSFRLRRTAVLGDRPGSVKLDIESLRLDDLNYMAKYLPLGVAIQELLAAVSPRGNIHSLHAKWSGEWPVLSSFDIKGRFVNLGTKKWKSLPAFKGMSGNLDMTQQRGVLNLNSRNAGLAAPSMLGEPLAFDALAGQVSWSVSSGGDFITFKFGNVSFSNSGGTGTAYGNYHLAADGKNKIDLVGHVQRADASRLMRYVPAAATRLFPEWLEQSVVEGKVVDARLHLKGDLTQFPFTKSHQGIFKLRLKAANVTVDHVPGWPRITDAAGNLRINGSHMEIEATKGFILDTRLDKAKIGIDDMTAPGGALRSEIEASGATMQFLKFAAASTADSQDNDLVDKIRVHGNGKLFLRLDVPLRRPGGMQLTGNYRLIDNQIDPGPHLPGLSQINGHLTFSGAGIKTVDVGGQALGGPVVVHSSGASDDGLHLVATGKANLDSIAESPWGDTRPAIQPWMRHLRGSTEWQAILRMRHNQVAEMSFHSSLRGIESELPEPFSKKAEDAAPLRFERKVVSADHDDLRLEYGRVVNARIERILGDSGRYEPRRGFINLGSSAATPPLLAEKNKVSVNVELPSLDLDRWDRLLTEVGNDEPANFPGVTSARLQAGTLILRGRRFNGVTLKADRKDDWWYSTISGDEINGGVSFHPSGSGKIVGRLNRLVIPAVSSEPNDGGPPGQGRKNLPALDITADNLVIDGKELGKLELIANQDQRNWFVDKLRISNPDSSIAARGIWRNGTAPRVRGTVTLQSDDVGKLLARLGHPQRLTRGIGILEGVLSWEGTPESIDYSTLSGAFQLRVQRGQFPRFEPGIGRLFGIFNLRSLPRRIRLDFHDVFSEGFGFDDITGDIKINRGVAATEGLRIDGPSAKVVMGGEMDLTAKTQRLHIEVTPSFGLVTPVVGMASVIARPALKNPPDTPNEYDITGTWADPVVVKIADETQDTGRHDQQDE